ncbi:tRNA1(Val) A37 N6-methylase TrmN6 [Litoreibacter ponti]|uniref:tRNA1(Val) A37 N6-methylase TrmN6 n=1 Tax=Litoreibacter ponti TaxID=1510457 RepID=A0A2T6BMR1_9RHOB|nr:methyltransferase domain-containing protein [Litoreibacter ponti]PTX57351.1 tRNA1(Val) A37 N6-methylase TrmN6 [Litoreibacter ponti]
MFDAAALTRDAFLGGRVQLWQPREGYRAATDPVLLAAACPAKEGQSVLELGCGVGTASLCLRARVPVGVTGVELQQDYAALARRNGLDEVICADIAAMPLELRQRSFDHVILNPPYYGPGTPARDVGRDTALREDTPLEAWIDSALRRAGPKGIVTVIHLGERLGALITLLNSRAGLLEVKPIAARAGRPAGRVILRLHKGRAARAVLYNPLILHAGEAHLRDGDDFTDAARAILRDAAPLEF